MRYSLKRVQYQGACAYKAADNGRGPPLLPKPPSPGVWGDLSSTAVLDRAISLRWITWNVVPEGSRQTESTQVHRGNRTQVVSRSSSGLGLGSVPAELPPPSPMRAMHVAGAASSSELRLHSMIRSSWCQAIPDVCYKATRSMPQQ